MEEPEATDIVIIAAHEIEDIILAYRGKNGQNAIPLSPIARDIYIGRLRIWWEIGGLAPPIPSIGVRKTSNGGFW